MVYLVTYDLNRPGNNYPNLYAAIDKYSHLEDSELDSVRFIDSPLTASQIYNDLLQHIDKNDRLLVTAMRAGTYAGWLNRDLVGWLGAHV